MISRNSQRTGFKVDSSVVFELGESLITDEVQALVELVKNSYDADARHAAVTINTEEVQPDSSAFPGAVGSITISDDGVGMDRDTIDNAWLTIAASPKRKLKQSKFPKTPGGRTPLGDKGLGRLGTQRLGANLEIVTRPARSNVGWRASFSWDAFRGARDIGSVSALVQPDTSRRLPGTTLTITGLKDVDYLRDTDASSSRLRLELSRLLSPYAGIEAFTVAVTVNGEQVDLPTISSTLRANALLTFALKYEDGCLHGSGLFRLRFFRFEPNADQKSRSAYERHIEADGGAAFLATLTSDPKIAQHWKLSSTSEPGVFFSVSCPVELPKRFEDPGPFSGEVDVFETDPALVGLSAEFASAKELRAYLKDLAGIQVYRDGFGVRVDADWLNLRSGWESGRSWYSLRPGNTFGYVAISAERNGALAEKTDREGFKDTPAYRSFHYLLTNFITETGRLLADLGRTRSKFLKSLDHPAPAGALARAPEEVAVEIGRQLYEANRSRGLLEQAASEIASYVATAVATPRPAAPLETGAGVTEKAGRDQLTLAQGQTSRALTLLGSLDRAQADLRVLREQIDDFRTQLRELYELASLGLTAETFSHEILQVIDGISKRSATIGPRVAKGLATPSEVTDFVLLIGDSVSTLRKQLAHLAPALRYVRERRDTISVSGFLANLVGYHAARLSQKGVRIRLTADDGSAFQIKMNQGRLTQVLDNLILNSEYWVRQQISEGEAKDGEVTLQAVRPCILVWDSGPGINPRVEASVFDPFVTTKPRDQGRGLGLFIAQQLLESEQCSLLLDPQRNSSGHLYRFRIDLGAVVEK